MDNRGQEWMRPGQLPAAELTTSSDSVELASRLANAGWQRDLLVGAQAALARWRVVEIVCDNASPLDVEVHWSAGNGAGQRALFTVTGAGRIAVFAKVFNYVRLTNLLEKANNVRVNIETTDGAVATRNLWVKEATSLNPPIDLNFAVPPFALYCRADCGVVAAYAGSNLQVIDAAGVVRANVTLNAQPDRGLPVAGATLVRVTPVAATDYRVSFELGI